MPIVVDREGQIAYQAEKRAVLQSNSNALLKVFFKYAEKHELRAEDICMQRILVPRIISRVEKRESYFLVFHNQMHINEIKQAALTAYWILKLKPFMIQSDDPLLKHKFCRINEGFALFYLCSVFEQCAQINHKRTREFSDKLMDEILYAFTYWDLSKESVILIAEVLAEAFYGIEAEGVACDGCNGSITG